jgi:hypothetical protein
VTRLERALVRIDTDLRVIGAAFALVGGLAVSLRAEPRTTRDVDLALAVDDDRAAEATTRGLLALGYRVAQQLEQDKARRLSSVRVRLPGEPKGGVVVDLLFASSGIEREVVDGAETLEVLPGVRMRVATAAHLVALKILAGRRQDWGDIDALLPTIDAAGHDVIRSSLELIARRGFDRQKDLLREYRRLVRAEADEREES